MSDALERVREALEIATCPGCSIGAKCAHQPCDQEAAKTTLSDHLTQAEQVQRERDALAEQVRVLCGDCMTETARIAEYVTENTQHAFALIDASCVTPLATYRALSPHAQETTCPACGSDDPKVRRYPCDRPDLLPMYGLSDSFHAQETGGEES